MLVDLTLLFEEFDSLVEFSLSKITYDDFGVPIDAVQKIVVECAVVDGKNGAKQNIRDESPTVIGDTSVWIRRDRIANLRSFLGASFFYGGDKYEIVGHKYREKFSNHVQYYATRRVD